MENPKRVWLITYGAASPNITHPLLQEHGILVDECYTLEQRDLKYTLINVPKRIRLKQMNATMGSLRESHAVILQELMGYEAVTGFYGPTEELFNHPGFKLIVHNIDKVHEWLAKGDMHTNQTSLLFNFVIPANLSSLSKGKLVSLFTDHVARSSEAKRKYESEVDLLAAQLSETQHQLHEADETIKRLKMRVVSLRALYEAATW